MKESNRDLSKKLDELYKSYENKESKVKVEENKRYQMLEDSRDGGEDICEKNTPLRKVNDFFK